MTPDLIGWISATILLLTLIRQVYSQWRHRTAAGVSRWLFVGQVLASTGFVVYSFLVSNWVFVVTNVLILLTAIAGEAVTLSNRKRSRLRATNSVVQFSPRLPRAPKTKPRSQVR